MATREAEFAASLLNGSLAGTLSDLVEHLGIPATTTEPLPMPAPEPLIPEPLADPDAGVVSGDLFLAPHAVTAAESKRAAMRVFMVVL